MARAMSNSIAAVILAAGKGTRMKSDLHKVLHPIAGRPMLLHLMASVDALRPAKKVVVVGDKAEQLEAALAGSADLAVQDPQLGTGHAVQQAEGALAGFDGDVLILYGDVPFVPAATMQAMIDRLPAPPTPGGRGVSPRSISSPPPPRRGGTAPATSPPPPMSPGSTAAPNSPP